MNVVQNLIFAVLLLVYSAGAFAFAHSSSYGPLDDAQTAQWYKTMMGMQTLSAQWPKKLQLLFQHALKSNETFSTSSFIAYDEPTIFTQHCGTSPQKNPYDFCKSEFLSFLDIITNSEAGEFPPVASEKEFQQADNDLNLVYNNVMTTLKSATNKKIIPMDNCADNPAQEDPHGICCQYVPDPADLRDAQRKWIKYRDAWIAFATARYSSVPAIDWKMELTRERLDHLKKIQATLSHFLDSSSPDYAPDPDDNN